MTIDALRRRSTADVFEDHLRLAREHHFDEDIERNVSPDVVILERRGIFRGREGTRQLARLLAPASTTGYWTKKSAGKDVPKPSLPESVAKGPKKQKPK